MKMLRSVVEWQYRWNVAQGFIGILLSLLTFAGVWTLLLGPVFSRFGMGYTETLLFLIGVVGVSILGFGLFLDRVVKIWQAQSLIGTVRNPFLIDRLYEKEWLKIRVGDLPMMKAMRQVVAEGIMSPHKRQLVEELDASIARLEQTVRDKKWTILQGENVYEDSYRR